MFATGALGAAETLYLRDSRGRSAFLNACLAGDEARKEAVLKQGVRLDVHEAAAAGDKARVEEILERNAGSVNHRDLDDATPLHYAAACSQIAMVNILLQRGTLLGTAAKGMDDATPAHLAAGIPDHKTAADLLETLVGNGAPAAARRGDGTAPLHIAARHGHAEAIRLLIRRGADPTALDHSGQTARDVATGEAAGILAQAGDIVRDCQSARYRSIARDDTYGLPQSWVNEFVIASHFDFDKVKRLYGQCRDLLLTRSTWDEIGVEAAAHMGREDIAEFFIEKGAPVSLCTACMLGMRGEVDLLLREDGKRVNERGAHDFPLLWYTAFGKERPEILEVLLAAGADVRSGMMGNTIVELARKKNYQRILDVVQAHG